MGVTTVPSGMSLRLKDGDLSSLFHRKGEGRTHHNNFHRGRPSLVGTGGYVIVTSGTLPIITPQKGVDLVPT